MLGVSCREEFVIDRGEARVSAVEVKFSFFSFQFSTLNFLLLPPVLPSAQRSFPTTRRLKHCYTGSTRRDVLKGFVRVAIGRL